MEEAEKAAIRACRPVLVNNMNSETVMDHLIAHGVLDEEDEARVNAEKISYDKNRFLLKLLTTTRNKKGVFDVFLRCLKAANQINLTKMLEDHVESPKLAGSRPGSATDIGKKLRSFGVPVRPEVFIDRDFLKKKVQKDILEIPDNGGWVLIYGMGGIGKTTLASSGLHCEAVVQKYNTIIWLPLGKLDAGNEKLLLKFKLLIQRLDTTSSTLPALTELEEAQNQLRDKLQDRSDSVLIVLDDVWHDDAKHFNNCGGSFLVTSRNKTALDRVSGFKKKTKIDTGFAYPQAEDIFVQVLNLLPNELPPEAKEIWKACEGSPFAIIRIASMLKNKPKRWNYYLQKLKERPDQIKQTTEYCYDSLDAVMRVSFEDLDSSLRNQYLKLAAFPKGTPLSAEVLAVLWDVEEVEEAEDIIGELIDLSLAREEWNVVLQSKFYLIHDLQMTFLRQEDKEKKSHKWLVEAYRRRYGLWHNLPDDKYFMWYIGHHLKEAGLTSELIDVFTNLRFIEAKIRITGAWDVISDYTRYQSVFEKHQQLYAMESFQEFLYKNMFALSASEQGQVVDLVQLALCDPPDRAVFPQAEMMAKERQEKPYWKWTNGRMAKSRCYKKYLVKWSTPLTAISISPNGCCVLIGRGDGHVTLMSGKTYQNLKNVLVEMQTNVEGVGFSADGTYCLVCTDSSIYRYKWPEIQPKRHSLPIDSLVSYDDDHMTKEFGRLTLAEDSERKDMTKLENAAIAEYVLSCCVALNNTAYVGTNSGTVIGVNLDPFTLRSEKNSHKEAITALAVSLDGRFVTSASSDRSVIVYDLEEMEEVARRQFDAAVQDCLLTATKDPEQLQVVSATAREISTWRVSNAEEVGKSIKSRVRDADFRVLALSADNRLLAASMSNYVIKLWDFSSKKSLFELPAVSGAPSALAFTADAARLLAVDNSGALVVWDVAATSARLDQDTNLIMAQRFALNWAASPGGLLASQDARSHHLICVQGLESSKYEKVTAQPLPFAIACVALSHDGARVAVGSEGGHLQEWLRAERQPSTPSQCVQDVKAEAPVVCLCYVRSGAGLAAGLENGEIWLLKEDGTRRVLTGHTMKISGLFDLDRTGRLLSTSHDGFVRLWRLEGESEAEGDGPVVLDALRFHDDRIISADVSAQQQWIVTGSVTGKAAIRKLTDPTAQPVTVDHGDCVRSARFCPQHDDLVATGDDGGKVRVWHACDPTKPVSKLVCPLDQEQWVVDLAWLSQDLLVSVCGVLCVWSVKSEQLLHTLYPRSSIFSQVRATQEGRGDSIVAVDSSGTLYLLKRV